MGTVINYEACQCGGVRVNERNYRTSEESDCCLKCGKFIEAFRYQDESGEYVVEEGVTPDGEAYERLALKIKTGGGYGSARLAFSNSVGGSMYFFNSKEDVLTFKNQVQSVHESKEIELDLNRTYIFSYDPDTLIGEVVFGFSKPDESDFLSSEDEVESDDLTSEMEWELEPCLYDTSSPF